MDDANNSLRTGLPITVTSPGLARRRRLHFVLANVGSLLFVPAALAWSLFFGVTVADIASLFIVYFLTAAGVEIGFHRHLTHKAFATSSWLRRVLAILGSAAAQGAPTVWVATHRRHHAFPDRPEDPHSPTKGFWYAHIWSFLDTNITCAARFAPDLLKDRDVKFVDRYYVVWVLGGLVMPGLISAAATQSWMAAVSGVIWAGGVRMFLLQHATFFINSVCHSFGKRPFLTNDHSTNVALMTIPTLGESLHNNHHAFPSSATTAVNPGDFDPAGILIGLMAKLRLIWNVRYADSVAVQRFLVEKEDSRSNLRT